jgi:hypothetical protein
MSKKTTKHPQNNPIQPNDIMQVVTPLTLAYKEILQHAFPSMEEKPLPELKKFADLIQLTAEEAAIIVMLYVKNESKSAITIKELSLFLAPILRITHRIIRTEIRHLMSLGLITYHHDEDTKNIELTHEATHAIDKGLLTFFHHIGPNGIEGMLEFSYKNIFELHRVTAYKLGETFDEIESKNPELEIVKYIQSNLLFAVPEELFTFLGILTYSYLRGDSFSYYYTEDNLQGSITRKMALKIQITEEQWSPMVEGYVEIAGAGLRDQTPELRLTEKGYDTFFGELGMEHTMQIRRKQQSLKTPLIQPNSIESTELYFSNDLQNQLDRISQILTVDRFNSFQSNATGKMKGLTILFYGPPGCGKTEFVLQLAKQTQRPIMKIEISDILDKWVGESEKNIKHIFRDYQKAAAALDTTPILFFNEADQLISRRLKANNGTEQMMNAMQNLLLEAMENFNGILIGTTNLETQMDTAFERRWIIKVNFTNPDNEALVKIWQQHIKILTLSEVEALVSEFPLNPGEIHNVVKRWNIELLLGITEDPITVLKRLCTSERFANKSKQTIIGFERTHHPTH